MNTIKTVKVSDLLPNPNRNLKHYQINPERVEALIASFKASGEWPGIIVRQREDGRLEKAFGEHRLAAHKKVYGDDSEVQVIVMDLDDAAMLRYMANENGDFWENLFLSQMETIESTVKSFAKGRIELHSPSIRGHAIKKIRQAPGFGPLGIREVRNLPSSGLYNATTLGEFLGWIEPRGGNSTAYRANPKVDQSLAALEFIEKGIFEHKHFEGFTPRLARILIDETRRVHRNAEAVQDSQAKKSLMIEVPREISDHLREEGSRTIHEITNSLMDEIAPRQDRLPMLDSVVDKLSAEIRGFIDVENENKRSRKIQEILDVQREMSHESLEKLGQLKASLDYLSRKCSEIAKAIIVRMPRRIGVPALHE